MLAGHRLALALGVVDSKAVLGDDEESRKQLIRAGEAMVNAGLAVVVNRAGTKAPFCTLHAVERKHADQEVRDAAAAAGDPLAHKRMHKCGLAHAITDVKTATRVLTRLSKRGRFNLGIEPRASRLVVVDLDTARQAAEFALRCGQDRPTLTVRSPGAQDAAGNWVHKDGGHIYFEVPEDVELPRNLGVYTHESGWKVMWGECQVLVPPSARAEGPYVLVGSTHPLPTWLLELIRSESAARQERTEESRRRRETSEPSEIDEWSRSVSWAEILVPDGWNDTGLLDNCGCPIWTAPGDHASLKSATAHEPGCSKYVCDRGHGPLRVWTDNPSEAVAEAVDAFGRTLTKIQVLTHTEGEGRMGRTLDDLGVERPGPTTIHSPFGTWVEDPEHTPTSNSSDADQDTPVDDEQDEDPADEPSMFTPEQMFERKVRREYEHELVRRAALERIQAADLPPLRVFNLRGIKDQPRPKGII